MYMSVCVCLCVSVSVCMCKKIRYVNQFGTVIIDLS